MSVRLNMTDLDGTLLRDDKTVSEQSVTALTACHEKGIKVVYATARGSSSEESRVYGIPSIE